MKYPSTWQAYWFIKQNRIRKKRKVRKQFVQLNFDLTTTIYSLVLVGYLFATIFIFNDFLGQFHEQFMFIESQMVDRFWLILTIVPIRFIFKSFREPGILITNSEYQLAMLPHSIKKIAVFVMVEKWLKSLIQYLLIATLAILITPIETMLIVIYFSLFWLMEVLCTIPQWKLFQSHIMIRISLFILLISLDIIGVFTSQSILISIFILMLMVATNLIYWKNMFMHIHWGRVIEVNDYMVWNMPLISKATKIKFKKQRKYSIFQNMASRRKPFPYRDSPIHRRLWIQLLRENVEFILQVIGGLFFVILVLPFISDLVTLIGIAISIHVYSVFISSIYRERFYSGIVQVLPWHVGSYRNTFTIWSILGFSPIFLAILIYTIIHFSWMMSLGFILLVISLYVVNYKTKMDNAMAILDRRIGTLTVRETIAFCSLGLIPLYEYHPSISLLIMVFIYLVLFLFNSSKKKNE
ncbi:hypothetical protein [Ornithinibacillus halotolerans]|uniref:Uncharacterized protein n=1 Tax=Ornithinibacillus halotolerans TaxID=1274357 RepID=A0A916S7D2_9BACI|nr:hypothetical protein [Ornithinibacillus halotolerans]GGA84306.1 hypothetical protein GCM10008025_29270 [Ornithinibacillus halotolerans]